MRIEISEQVLHAAVGGVAVGITRESLYKGEQQFHFGGYRRRLRVSIFPIITEAVGARQTVRRALSTMRGRTILTACELF